MDHSEENQALVAFTTLAPLSVGGLIGLLLVDGPRPGTSLDLAGATLLAVGILGLAASLLHLGRPFRAYRALVRLSTSWLSREVWLFGLFLLGLAVYTAPVALDASGQTRVLLGTATAVVGVIALLASGEIYRLQARPAWNHWATTVTFASGALSAGVLVGLAVCGMNGAPGSGLASATMLASVLLVLASVLTYLRTSQISGANEEGRATRRLVFGTYRWTLVVRFAGAALALALILTGYWALAWVPAALGELADRIGFYYAVVPVSPAKRYGIPPFTPVPWKTSGAR